jgi:hypothetical protein
MDSPGDRLDRGQHGLYDLVHSSSRPSLTSAATTFWEISNYS